MVYEDRKMEVTTEDKNNIINEERTLDANNANNSSPSGNSIKISPKGKKRRKADTGDSPSKRIKQRNGNMLPILHNRTSVAVLNELRAKLEYKLVSQDGPVHMPIFTMSVEVDGEVYIGKGRSKKLAKGEAADAALRNIIQFKDGAGAFANNVQNQDFTSDVFPPSERDGLCENNANIAPVPDKGPVMLLNEMFNNVRFEESSEIGTQFAKFKMFVHVNDKKFEGTGPSKKLAKAAAAKSALCSLSNLSFTQEFSPKNSSTKFPPELKQYMLSQQVADRIGKLVIDTFLQLMTNDPLHARRKVLAGVVLTRGLDMDDLELVSVSTGTKCVSGAYISTRGLALNDSHAEIVARRCLVDYMYKHLEMHMTPETVEQSIFVKDVHTNMFRLKEGIRFHLYINTAPCGDARIFSPHEESMIGVDKHPNRHARGQLRTKIESGEGTIPAKNSSGIQTWDGVIQGDRLLTMSCSDKLCRWNVIGVQGALLANIVEPVYLHSVVLGSLLHPVHMHRAICGRVEDNLVGLPPPYRLNKPSLALLTSAENRNPIKAPSFGVNWTTGNDQVEIVNALNGKTVSGQTSRLSKTSFYRRYIRLMSKLQPHRKIPNVYSDAKATATDYKIVKDMLHAAFRSSGLGSWLGKPIEQDQFELEEAMANNH